MTADLDTLDRAARAAVAASDWPAAVSAFTALALGAPGNPRPWYSLALAHTRAGAPAIVVAPAIRRCLMLAPDHAGAWVMAATVGKWQDGYRRAALLPGASIGALRVAAALRQEAGDAPGAIALLDRVLASEPDDAECRINRAMALIETGRKSAALDDLDRALALVPGDSRARWSRGWILLGRRDWSGAGDYAARWLDPEPDSRQHQFDLPLWDGGPVDGGPLLLWGQFGVGDEILFATLAADAAARAGDAVLETDPRLVALLGRSLAGITVVPRSDPPDPGIAERRPAAQSSTARLPTVLPHEAMTGPRPVAPLHADPSRVGYWRDRFEALGPAPYRGLAWRSGNRRTAGRKSIPLGDLAPVLRAGGGSWISLQYDPDPDETAEVAAARRPVPIDNPADDIRNDLDELAAQIAALDEVVTISGINAHLAGALGVPGLVLMQRDPLWFWFEDGETVPWYPSLTILRQRGTKWDSVIAEAARRLSAG